MSHVDEGALHAYLDGALDEYPVAEARRIREHLDVCATCAERLEVERGLRSDAHAMLGMAAPVVDLPSFEELRAYVERTRPAPSRTSVRITRLSWAASVMLALGVGWTLRGGRMEPAADMNRAAPVAAMEQELLAPAQEAVPEAGPANFADASVVVERSVSGAPAEEIEPGAFESRADLPTTAVAVTAVEVDEPVSEKSEGDPAEPAEAMTAGSGLVAEALAPAAPADQPDARLDPIIVTTRRSQAADAMAARVTEAPATTLNVSADDTATLGLADADVVASAEPVEDEEEVRPERRRSESRTAFTSQFSSGRGGVRVVPEGDDRF